MQFVALIYQGTTPLPGSEAWDALSGDEQQQIYADYGSFNQAPGVTAGLPLGASADATTVRVDGGAPIRTPGPYVDEKGAVGGYVVIEADDLDAAVEVVSRVPSARLGGAVEIRPVARYW